MGWLAKTIILLGLQCLSTSLSLPHQFPSILEDDFSSSEFYNNYLDATDMEKYISEFHPEIIQTIRQEKMQQLGDYLTGLLLKPNNGKGLPILYIEDKLEEVSAPIDNTILPISESWNDESSLVDIDRITPRKRAHHSRKYPWKRQHPGSTYDAENRFICQPTREDVYRLLVALHETRQARALDADGLPAAKGRTVHFCNRKRPAHVIFTHMRFLG